MLAVITTFFAVALVAVAAAVAPMGWAALPALGFRAVGWRPVVLGVLVTEVLSVGVSQLGIEPEGMKEVIRDRPRARLVRRQPPRTGRPGAAGRGADLPWPALRLAGRPLGNHRRLDRELAGLRRRPHRTAHIVLVLPLGLWFGWLRRRTGSLWPSLVAHIVNNGLAVAAAAYLDI